MNTPATTGFSDADDSLGGFGGASDLAQIIQVGTEVGPGALLGGYRLEQKIGQAGSFGSVWKANKVGQVSPVYAVKICHHQESEEQLAELAGRFFNEIQAMKRLDHPQIPKIRDYGQTASGRPYFVMDLVLGSTLGEHCEQHRPSLQERLRLFLSICKAVEHAHLNLIHRDLKPSNIIVGKLDQEATAFVVDFGIAKGIIQPLGMEGQGTLIGMTIGSPAYMSPEQACSSLTPVDARSDIYSLGVILYELLSGGLPFSPGALGNDFLRSLLTDEAPRFEKLAETSLRSQSKKMGLSPGELRSQLTGDLEWIVRKCLAKSPSERYTSVGLLAADVRAWLDGREVSAMAPTAWYSAKKFIRRHRLSVGAIAAVSLTVLTGLVVSIHQYLRAEMLRSEANIAKGKATASRDEAEKFLEFLLADHSRLLAKEGDSEGAERIQERVREYYSKVSPEPGDAAQQRRRAWAFVQSGDMYREKGNLGKAGEDYAKAIPMLEKLVRDNPPETKYKLDLGTCWGSLGLTQKPKQARKSNETSVGILKEVKAKEPENLDAARELGVVLVNLAKLLIQPQETEQADRLMEEALEIRKSLVANMESNVVWQTDLARLHLQQANMQAARGVWNNSKTACEAAWDAIQKLPEANQDAETRLLMAKCKQLLGRIAMMTNRPHDAREALGQAKELLLKLAKDSPANASFAYTLSCCYIELGHLANSKQEHPDAVANYSLATSKLSELIKAAPSDDYTSTLATAYELLGNTQESQQQPGAAQDAYQAAQHILQDLLSTGKRDANLQAQLKSVNDALLKLRATNTPN